MPNWISERVKGSPRPFAVRLCISERNISRAAAIHSEAEAPHTERLSIVSGKAKSASVWTLYIGHASTGGHTGL
jgi:hypothetical protein